MTLTYHEKVLLICKAMWHTTYIVRIGDVLEYVVENNTKKITDFTEYYALNNEIIDYRPFLSKPIPLYPEEQREPLIDYLLTLIPSEQCQTK